MKTRTKIQLEPEQHQRLKELARRERRSLSDLIREIIDGYLAGNQPRSAPGEDAWAFVGCFSDPRTDVAAHHDDYLHE